MLRYQDPGRGGIIRGTASGSTIAPDIAETVASLRQIVREWRMQSLSVGLVPTMGALHDGHAALVRKSIAQCDRTVVSIFVNPKQFAPHEDFATYPRNEDADLALLAGLGAQLVYMPNAQEMYAEGFASSVTVSHLTESLCGASRPHFFQGVATVVTKLLLQCLPDYAYFGEKDYQQLQVVRRMVRDLDIPSTIVGVPTVREADGLALSSRNAYLKPAQREIAPLLHQTLQQVAGRMRGGESAAAAAAWGRRHLENSGFTEVDYLEVRTADALAPIETVLAPGQDARILAAAFLGKTRLIDNIAA
jgi:pantoate--beta-alanine ligase